MKNILISLIILFNLFGCNSIKKIEKEKFLFGTFIKITVFSENKTLAENSVKKAFDEITRVQDEYNPYKKGSKFYNLNHNSGKYIKVSNEEIMMLKDAIKMSELTNGKYDITIAPIMKLWNFKEEKAKALPNQKKLKEKLNLVDYKKIKIDNNFVKIGKNQEIDTGSFLKGYAIYRAREILKKNGIKSAFISAISSIEVIGEKPNNKKWKIGIQNPENKEKILKILEVSNVSIGVSGDYQTYKIINGKKYHHLIDATTGYPARENKMVVILAKNSYIADLYSTALFPLKKEKILKIVNFNKDLEAMIVDKNMNISYSSNFENYISKEKK
ncbi:FAD:protein FMN transferase [Haliovirga abyssi]|uniref:FAD:protein FMN transferase n=1 Tax=Haliovirga abyssi TaxID=2996794 RepID=A0AAU9DD59_9FUSO|nr:FAD:protein FMN transferase [Haliovirga abyssi]BDU51280.1 FAD:protein FMN transferase [Haliovirga abyssi]